MQAPNEYPRPDEYLSELLPAAREGIEFYEFAPREKDGGLIRNSCGLLHIMRHNHDRIFS